MKTIRFGKIDLELLDNGEARLTVASPGQGAVDILLTAEELYKFMVDVGNMQSDLREVLKQRQIERDVLNEERKSKASGPRCTTTG